MMLDICLVSDGLIPALESLDKQLLLEVNGSDSLYLDRVAHKLTNALAWIPFYISLFYVVLKNNDSFRKILLVLGAVSVCVLLAGMVDDMIVKPTVARWRPTHDPEIGPLVDVVDGYRGGKYGFFSAHAANTFSIAIFFCWMVRSRLLSLATKEVGEDNPFRYYTEVYGVGFDKVKRYASQFEFDDAQNKYREAYLVHLISEYTFASGDMYLSYEKLLSLLEHYGRMENLDEILERCIEKQCF